MSHEIAISAQRAADHLAEDMHNKDHGGSLDRIINDIEAQKRALSPAQYREFLTTLNSDVAHLLPDLTIVGTMTQLGRPDLIVKDQTGSTSFLGANAIQRLDWIEKHHTRVFIRPDGTRVEQEFDGSRKEFRQISAGEWTLRRTGPNNSEGSFTHQYTDGRQLTRYSDGRTVDSKTAKDGSFKVVGTGPRPHDNYVSEATKNGDLYIKYADQSRGRVYYSHTERKH